jgi:hypothetical protein
MRLLKTQKNELFDLISQVGLLPTLFHFKEYIFAGDESYVTEINVEGTHYFFRLREDFGHNFTLNYSPALDAVEREMKRLSGWNEAITHFAWWLQSLKQEMETSDKWQEAFQVAQQATLGADEIEDSRFTKEELTRIESAFADIRQQLTHHSSITEKELGAINSKLEYLLEEAKTRKKREWRMLFYGAFMELMIHEEVHAHIAALVLGLLKTAFQDMFFRLLTG